jgi:hypothetical protein
LYGLRWLSILDREYLEDYQQKAKAEFKKFSRRIQEGKFDFRKDRYPPNERFVKLEEPVAMGSFFAANLDDVWAQLPFCGSLVLKIPQYPLNLFERILFKASEIPKVIDFIKETGRLQVVLATNLLAYEGLDYLDPFFKELNPPVDSGLPLEFLATEKELQEAFVTFHALAEVRFFGYLRQAAQEYGRPQAFRTLALAMQETYAALKLGRYIIVEDIEDLLVADPEKAFALLCVSQTFIKNPIINLRYDLTNFTLEDIRISKVLPVVYQPQELWFPCEIGKFLVEKLTYAPQGLRACNELIDHYDAYDLQKVQESLNEAIVANHPDIINKSAEEFSEILDNVWNDPAVPRRIKNLRRGIPMSVAAIGAAVSAFGGIGGFLAGLGFNVGAAFLKADIERLSEKVGKFFAKRSYQANVYDFKKKYEHRIVRTQKKEHD